jgi:hypothetical protein
MDNTGTPPARLLHPSICQHCRNLAYWAVHHKPLCYLHLRELEAQGKGIAAILDEALISPVITSASHNDVTIAVYPTTCIAPICAMLNQLFLILPGVDSGAEICIELWQDRLSIVGSVLQCEGRGYYHIDSRTLGPVLCHAPLIKLARAPIGRMAGFMKLLNDHSLRIRECVKQEFVEEEAANG